MLPGASVEYQAGEAVDGPRLYAISTSLRSILLSAGNRLK